MRAVVEGRRLALLRGLLQLLELLESHLHLLCVLRALGGIFDASATAALVVANRSTPGPAARRATPAAE